MMTSDPIGRNAGAGIGITCAVRPVASISANNTPPKLLVITFLIFDTLILFTKCVAAFPSASADLMQARLLALKVVSD